MRLSHSYESNSGVKLHRAAVTRFVGRWGLLIAAVFAQCAMSGSLCAAQQTKPQAPQQPKSQPLPKSPAQSASSDSPEMLMYLMGIPSLITAEQTQRMRDMLSLSDAQGLAFNSLVEAANERLQHILDQELPRLAQLWDIGMHAGGIGDVATWRDAFALRDRLVADIEGQETSCFAEVGELLTEVQRPALGRVEMFRARARANALPSYFPGADVDLLELVWMLGHEAWWRVNDAEVFANECAAYEAEITPLFQQRSLARASAMRDEDLIIERINAAVSGSRASNDGLSQLRSLYRRFLRPCQRCLDVNTSYVSRLCAALDATSAARLRDAFLALAYPNVCPNPYDLRELFAQFAGIPGNEHLGTVKSIEDRWSASTEKLTHDMIEAHREWIAIYWVMHDPDGPEFGPYATRLTELQRARESVSREALGALERQVPPETWSRLKPEIARVQDAMTKHKSSRNGPTFYP